MYFVLVAVAVEIDNLPLREQVGMAEMAVEEKVVVWLPAQAQIMERQVQLIWVVVAVPVRMLLQEEQAVQA
tara:strand:- start:27 stop:239 length:213 start_codon:yes stop_codon:yes gene_type:complete